MNMWDNFPLPVHTNKEVSGNNDLVPKYLEE